jgi:glycogen(starch) synthase
MRILVLTWEYPPKGVGGLAQHVYDLTHALRDKGHELTIVTAGDDESIEHEQQENLQIFRVKPFPVTGNDFLSWVFQLNFAMLEKCFTLTQTGYEFDIIHAHDWLVAFSARALKFGLHLPLVATIHATEYGRNQGLHNGLQRYISDVEWWLTYEAWKVIVCSNYMNNEVENIFQVPSDKIHVIPNGVELNGFKALDENFKRSNYASDDEKIVFFIGRLVPEKGLHILLDAASKVIYHYPKAKFVIAGKGPSADYLRAKATILGMEDRCYFTGYINDKVRNSLYRASDVAVFPSIYEPFGIVALEAMAAGVPVVVSDTGGLSEIVNHGMDGLKAIQGNAGSLANSILTLLKDKKLAMSLASNATEKVRNEFSWHTIADKTESVYNEVILEAKKFSYPKDDLSRNTLARFLKPTTER